jgi:hypothetical protein
LLSSSPELGELGKPRDRRRSLPIELCDPRLGILDRGIHIDGHRRDFQRRSGLNHENAESSDFVAAV